MEVDDSCCIVFLSGQAASHIPEFPSFFCTNTYTLSVQLFPVEGKRSKKGSQSIIFIIFFKSTPIQTPVFSSVFTVRLMMVAISPLTLWVSDLSEHLCRAMQGCFFHFFSSLIHTNSLYFLLLR